MSKVNSQMAIVAIFSNDWINYLAALRINQANTIYIIFSLIWGHWLTVLNLSTIFISCSPVCCSFCSHSFIDMWFALLIKRDPEKDHWEILGHSSLGHQFSGCTKRFLQQTGSWGEGLGSNKPSSSEMFQLLIITTELDKWVAPFLPMNQGRIYRNHP